MKQASFTSPQLEINVGECATALPCCCGYTMAGAEQFTETPAFRVID